LGNALALTIANDTLHEASACLQMLRQHVQAPPIDMNGPHPASEDNQHPHVGCSTWVFFWWCHMSWMKYYPPGWHYEPKQGSETMAQNTQNHDDEYGELLDAFDQRVAAAVAPIREENKQLRQRMNELSKPTRNAQAVFAAPAVRQGENSMSSRGFSFTRLAAVTNNLLDPNEAKLELALSRQLRQHYQNMGFPAASAHKDSLLIPLGSSMLPDAVQDCGEDRYSRDDIRQMLSSELRLADSESIRQTGQRLGLPATRINQALSTFDTTGLGVFTDGAATGELIELVKAVSVLERAGARSITLPENGYLKFPRHTGSVTAGWVGEASSITKSEPTTGSMELRAKKAAVLTMLPAELIRFGGADVEAFIRADMASELALTVDTAGLEGVGSTNEPKGILSHDGIVTHTAGTVAANGNTFEPEDPSLMLAELEERNYDPDREGAAWLMRGKMWRNLLNRRSGALDSNDAADNSVGQWLFDVNRAAIQNGAPSMLLGHPVIRSAQISDTREKGSSSDLTYIMVGIFRHLLIGRVGVLEVLTSNSATIDGTNLFATDQIGIRAISHVDVGLRHENAFVLVDDIDMDLPA